MINERQETIADIVAVMLEFAETDSQTIGRDVLRRRIQYFAMRLEVAAKRKLEAGAEAAQICGEIGEMIGREAAGKETVTDCNGLGNAAKMREALERCASMGDQIDNQLGSSEDTVYAFRGERCLAHNISECARAALSAPPRNCDRPECATTKAAQDVWRKEDGGKTAYYEWLLATYTKGGTDGRK